MKKVNVEMNRKEINETAKALEIKFVGVKTVDLVEAINKKIDELTPKAAPKAKKSLEEVGFKENQYVVINGSVLKGRSVKLDGRQAMVKEISGSGMVRVILVNPKNGQLQGCTIPMPVEAITAIETQIMVVA